MLQLLRSSAPFPALLPSVDHSLLPSTLHYSAKWPRPLVTKTNAAARAANRQRQQHQAPTASSNVNGTNRGVCKARDAQRWPQWHLDKTGPFIYRNCALSEMHFGNETRRACTKILPFDGQFKLESREINRKASLEKS